MSENPMGKMTEYPERYDPGLLFTLPRSVNRKQIGLTDSLPFKGEDIWHAYELSWLNRQGLPQVAMGTFSFACESPFLIESKSLKLYLNSLNQKVFDDSQRVIELLVKDLSEKSGADVKVELLDLAASQQIVSRPQGLCLDTLDIQVNKYQPDAGLLVLDESRQVEEQLYTNLFRS